MRSVGVREDDPGPQTRRPRKLSPLCLLEQPPPTLGTGLASGWAGRLHAEALLRGVRPQGGAQRASRFRGVPAPPAPAPARAPVSTVERGSPSGFTWWGNEPQSPAEQRAEGCTFSEFQRRSCGCEHFLGRVSPIRRTAKKTPVSGGCLKPRFHNDFQVQSLLPLIAPPAPGSAGGPGCKRRPFPREGVVPLPLCTGRVSPGMAAVAETPGLQLPPPCAEGGGLPGMGGAGAGGQHTGSPAPLPEARLHGRETDGRGKVAWSQ